MRASTSRSWTIRSRAVIEESASRSSAPLAGSTRARSGPRDGSCPRRTTPRRSSAARCTSGARLGPAGPLDARTSGAARRPSATSGARRRGGPWRRARPGPPGGVVGSRRRLRRKRRFFFLDPEPTEAPGARGTSRARRTTAFCSPRRRGGCALADADVHAADTWSHRWVKPRAVTGKPPRARAGHAACAVGTHCTSAAAATTPRRAETHRLEMHDAASGEYHRSVLDPGGDPGDPRGRGDVGAGFEGMSPRAGPGHGISSSRSGSDGKCVDATRACASATGRRRGGGRESRQRRRRLSERSIVDRAAKRLLISSPPA